MLAVRALWRAFQLGLTLLATFPLTLSFPLVVNILPRFFISELLFFAGAGFLVENLWGCKDKLPADELAQVCLIVIVFCATGMSLLFAVGTGVMLACFGFVYRFSTIPALKVVTTLAYAPARSLPHVWERKVKLVL